MSELDDIQYLKSTGYPASVIEHFRAGGDYEDINNVRMDSVAGIKQENEDAIPGYVICPMGYLNIASTIMGDTYCLDLNTRNAAGEPTVVLVSHDEVEEGSSPEEVANALIRIAHSFDEFVARFRAGALPSDYYHAKDAAEGDGPSG